MIDRQLKKDYAKNAKIAKLLLLGAGESGKSTIVKQMKLLYPVNNRDSAGFSEDEKEETKFAIYSNILDSIMALLHAVTGTNAHWDFELFSSSNHISPLLNRPQGCQGCQKNRKDQRITTTIRFAANFLPNLKKI